jgi:hypothetical protein
MTGGTIQAADITTLYNTLNAFVIPDTIGVMQQGLVNDTLYTVATGNSQDWSVTVTKNKAIFWMFSFSWSGASAAPTFTVRLNASAITSAITFAGSVATGNGIFTGWIGGHDTDVPRPAVFKVVESNAPAAQLVIMPNTDLPNASTSSLGIAIGGTGNTFKLKYLRIWKEG